MGIQNILIILSIVACLMSTSMATPGIATYYTTYIPSACYNYTQEGVMIAAAGDAIWNNGAACGKFVTVKCTGPRNLAPPPCTNENVTVKIIDHCPGCPFTLDLSKEAFTKIANPMGGIINIDYYL
ncbi:putative EG45-like domain containing protein 1 [Rosa chinensis]|uniref:putative EG45-like domain containing protein 1 n=1 Tax=Rosa chinensis TaxID=74649 RepID=UPI000D08DB66|nr:putative EG45-like domain containing protein 1 [Rosa chinensis]